MGNSSRAAVSSLIGLAAAAMLAAPAAAERPFAPSSVWNKPLAADARLAPNSRSLVSELMRQRRFSTPWVNTTTYSTPVYTVGPATAAAPVHVDTPSALFSSPADAEALRPRLGAVPIPDGARPAAGVNRHMVVWQPSTDTMWELWNAHRVPDEPSPWKTDSILGWHAAWGARIDRASSNAGTGQAPFGATASGLPLMGGLIRLSEWRSLKIRHALALGIHDIAADSPVWPANRTDGGYRGRGAIPMGTRFRLDPRVDIDSLRLSPAGRAIALAAQRYGMVVRDHADKSFALYGEDPAPTGQNPYPRVFGGLRPDQVLRGFPWRQLEAVAPVASP
jgi:hypothetical protein